MNYLLSIRRCLFKQPFTQRVLADGNHFAIGKPDCLFMELVMIGYLLQTYFLKHDLITFDQQWGFLKSKQIAWDQFANIIWQSLPAVTNNYFIWCALLDTNLEFQNIEILPVI